MFRTRQEVDKHVNSSLKKINNVTERNLRCFSFAKLYFNVGDYEQTVRYVTSYLSVKPKSPEGHNLLGKALEKLGKKDAALEAYRTSLQQDPKQNNLVIKVCELMAQDDVDMDNSGARYFCDLAQSFDPQNPVVSTLKEKLITSDSNDPEHVSKFLIKELENRPTDVVLRVRLLKHFMQNHMVKEAYKHASDIDEKKLGIFENSLPWYEAFAEVLVRYQRDSSISTQLTWEFWFLSVSVLEKLAALSLDEHQENVKSSIDYVMAVFNFDQSLSKASQHVDLCPDKMLLKVFLAHYEAQLCLHLCVLAFKQAKKDMMTFKEVQNMVLPLLFISYNGGPPDVQSVWFNNCPENRRKMVVGWHREGSFRCSQSGHILVSLAKDRKNILLEKANQYSTGMWREQLFKKIFVKRDQHLKTSTSFFISSILDPVIKLPDYADLMKYDEVAQTVYPDSLHHYIWIAVNSQNISDFTLRPFDGLQYTVKNLSNCAAEAINVLDVQSFVYCAALCAQSKIKNADNSLTYFSQDRPSVLPVSITGNLGTLNQSKFVSAAYKMYKNEHTSNMGEIRLLLIKGIEVIRCVGNHGLDVKLLVILATIFSERSKILTKQAEIEANSARAELYWKTALPLLEKLKNNHAVVYPNNRLFEYKSNKDLTQDEISSYIEKAKLFLGVQLMKKKEYEKAMHTFESLKDPYSSFYQSQIYKHMADAKTNQNKENLTSEMRSQNIILLSRARDCLYLTLDRLREPSQDRDHPLNAQLGTEIEKIERLLSRIDPDCTNRNECDGMSDENVSDSSAGEHYLSTYTHHNSFHNGRDYSGKNDTHLQHSTPLRLGVPRQEARPSPERLDAQLRQLAASKDLALNSVLEQNRMMTDFQKSLMEEIRGFKDAVKNLTATVDEQAKSFTGFFGDVKQVKKSVDDLTSSVDDRLQGVTDMVQEMRKELNDVKKDQNKNAQLSVEDLYELGNDPDYSAALDYNLSSNLGNAQPTLNSMVSSMYPHYPPPRLPQGPAPNLAAYGGQALYPGLYPGLPYPYGALGLPQAFLPPPGDQQQLQGQLGQLPNIPGFAIPTASLQSLNSMILGTPSQAVPPQPNESPKNVFASTGLPQAGFAPNLGTQASQGLLLTKDSPKPTLSSSTVSGYGPSGLLGQSLSISSTANATAPFSKAPPVNVVITSSDPLPSINTTTAQPVLSVTIPPQHIKGNVQKPQVTAQVSQTPTTPQAHNYQIPLPANKMVTTPSVLSQPAPLVSTQSLLSNVPSPAFSAISKGQSPSKNVSLGIQIENTLNKTFSPDRTNTSVNRSSVSSTSIDEYDPRPDFQPLIPLPDEVPVNTGEERETELFCQRAKLFRLAVTNDVKEWKERGVGNIKILFNPETGKVRVIMRREQVHKICANHFLTKDTSLTPMANNDRAYIWAAHDYADGEIVLEKFCVRFKTAEEAKKFADAFELARTKISDKPVEIRKEPASALKLETPKTPVTLAPVIQTNLGGFKFTSTPTFKLAEEIPTTPKVEEVKQIVKEPVHISPFAGFSFGVKTTATVKHGLDSLTTQSESPRKEDDDSAVDEFVPNAEFKPVVEKIPDLIEVKTGEENAEILFDERAKLFRYDTSGETNEWKERGLGNIKILKENTIRLVMRREQVHKVCLNHQILKNMSFKQNTTNPKAVIWHAQDFSEGVLKPETFSVRFKTEELASTFLRTLQSVQTTMDESNQVTGKHHKPEVSPKATGFGEKFKPAKGSWECKNCYISNEGKTSHCVACDTPRAGSTPKKEEPTFSFGVKPATAIPTKPVAVVARNEGDTNAAFSVSGWGNQFKPAEGTWECEMCLVRNSPDKTKCMSCETPRDGEEDGKSVAGGLKGISLDTGGQVFSFGIPTGQSAQASAQKVDATVVTAQKTEQPIQKFSFSVPPPTKSDPNAILSGFGDSFKPKVGTWECKTCYIRNDPSSQYCLSCDTPKDETVPKKESEPKGVNLETPGLKFTFGMPIASNVSSGFAFGDTKTTFSWKPTTESATVESSVAPNAQDNETETKDQFVFGSPQKHEFEFKPRSPRRISTGQGDESDASYVEEEEEANVYFKPVVPLPDIVEVKTGEEDQDILYSHRAKLYRFAGGEWKERGLGDVKILKDTGTGKLRVVMRREQVFKICLNHWLTSDIEYLPKDEKSWLFHAADFSEGELNRDQFCLRFKNADVALEFKNALDRALGGAETDEKPAEGKKPIETKSEDSDSEVEFVSETVVTAEEEKEAIRLGLPPKFFAYRQRPDCTCEQCKKEDEYLKELFSHEPSTQKSSLNLGSTSAFGTPVASLGTPSSAGSVFATPTAKSFTLTTGTGQTPIDSQPQRSETLKELLQRAPLTPQTTPKTAFTFKLNTQPAPTSILTTPTLNNEKAGLDMSIPAVSQATPSDQSKPSFSFGGSQSTLFGSNKQNLFQTSATNIFGASDTSGGLFKSNGGNIFGDGAPKEGSTPTVFGGNTPKEASGAKIFGAEGIAKESNIITANIFGSTTKPSSVFGSSSAGNLFTTPQSKEALSSSSSTPSLFGGGTANQGNIFTIDLTKSDSKTNIFAGSQAEPSTSATRFCKPCKLEITLNRWDGHQKSHQHKSNCSVVQGEGVSLIRTSFRGRLATYRIEGTEDSTNVKKFLQNLKNKTIALVESNVNLHDNIKVGMELFGRFLLQSKEAMEVKSFNSKFRVVSGNTDLEELFDQTATIMDKKAIEFQEKDSDASKNTTNIFGSAKTNLFQSSSTASNISGSSIFGSTVGSGSGSSSNTSIFGSATGSTGSIFGGGAQAQTTPLFGPSTQSNIFGAPKVAGSVFGQTLFGSKTEPKVTDANLTFGTSTTTNLKETDEPVLKVESDLSFATLAAQSEPKAEPTFASSKKGDDTSPFAFLGAGAPVFGGPKKKAQKSLAKGKTEKDGSDDEEEAGDVQDDKEHDPHFEPIVPLPDQIVVSTGEEDETALFNERAKLFRYDNATREWKERGVGQIKVLFHPQNQSYRLLLRREQVHKVVLNQRVTPDLDVQPMVTSDKAWVWAGYNYTDDESNLEQLAVRFKNVEIAQSFKRSIDEAIRKVIEIQANRSQQSDSLPTTVQEFGLEDVSNEDIQNYEDDQDDVEDEEEEDDDEDEDEDDEDERSIMFTKRCTLSEQDDAGGWQPVGMGELQVYYDPELYAARISVAQDNGEALSNTLIGLNTIMEIQGKECWWKAVEWAHTDQLHWRTLKATFSSSAAAQEFHSNYMEGINLAQEVGIVDELPMEGPHELH